MLYILGSWLFLGGSIAFTYDALKMRKVNMVPLIGCALFDIGCVLFVIDSHIRDT